MTEKMKLDVRERLSPNTSSNVTRPRAIRNAAESIPEPFPYSRYPCKHLVPAWLNILLNCARRDGKGSLAPVVREGFAVSHRSQWGLSTFPWCNDAALLAQLHTSAIHYCSLVHDSAQFFGSLHGVHQAPCTRASFLTAPELPVPLTARTGPLLEKFHTCPSQRLDSDHCLSGSF